ncbi:Cof-type HAD-IIB family hydrolase [Paenibacillus campinasensis]|uniref:Cof-type HAD-IIB family hydrolase n=1 Tax=Paenibacillus campinasensis TaxID=66347 RepID=A0A268ETM9_9BACL|nr:Cof-type HAD-IIB family hydrolase [Paenibacillus campinasensis]PAD76483.1 hypothetical protein CHH67_12775 [Paenibacillus campinasensis]
MYKLLALDMDGTLLNSDKMITPQTMAAIRQLMRAGVNVTIASGRFPASVWLHAREVGMNFPLVALNGAVTIDADTGHLLDGTPLLPEDALTLLDLAETAGAYIHFYGFNVLYVRELNDMNRRWPLHNVVVRANRELNEVNYRDQTMLIRVEDVGGDYRKFIRSTGDPIYKAAVICHDQTAREQLYQALEQQGRYQLSRTGSLRFDVNAAGVTKRGALERLCAAHDIPAREVAAAGDYDNDLDMLQWAGLGIAMGNAEPHVKERAAVVTGSNREDGVAEAIHRHLLLKATS